MHSFADIPTLKLHNGIRMPQIGFGVYKIENGDDVETAINHALNAGYRAIDTAAIYGNEEGVGKAIAYSGIPREEIFVTTKLWNDDQGYENAHAAVEASLERLGLDYLDLYLIHWPKPKEQKFIESWKALEEMYEDGKVRAIGVSNFTPQHLSQLMHETKIVPMVNQIELHPMFSQPETRSFCVDHNIVVESWSPLMQGKELLSHKTIAGIANAHSKDPGQIVLRWHIQSGLIVIPKSVSQKRIASNINIFNFELSKDEMQRIDALNAHNNRVGPNPDTF